jgi:Flp pilus assembly protein TadB
LPVYLDCLFVLALSVFSFSSSRVFCGRCCQCIWIVYLCLPFLFSLFLRQVSFVSGVASVSGLSICACPFCFLFFFVTCLLFPVLLVWASTNRQSRYTGNTGHKRHVTKKKRKKKGQAQIDNPDTLGLPFLFSLFPRHVSFVPGVASVSGLSICACPFYFLFFLVTCLLFPLLPVYLDCLFVLAFTNRQSRYTGNTGNKRHVTRKKRK